ILAKLRVFPEPRPPHAPRTSAGPTNTGISLRGSATCAACKVYQLDASDGTDGVVVLVTARKWLGRLAVHPVMDERLCPWFAGLGGLDELARNGDYVIGLLCELATQGVREHALCLRCVLVTDRCAGH